MKGRLTQPKKIKVTAWACRRCGAYFAEDKWKAKDGKMVVDKSALSRAWDHEKDCIGDLVEQDDGSWRKP